MSVPIHIRPPKEDEKREFYEVFQSGLPFVDETSYEHFSRWWDNCLKDHTLTDFWLVAEDRGKIVGIVITTLFDNLQWGYIWELAVIPERRGEKIGTLLMQEAEKALLKYKESFDYFTLGIKITNHKALNFYQKLDYSIRFLVLNFQGEKWRVSKQKNAEIVPASKEHVSSLVTLIAGVYWSKCSKEDWERVVERPNQYVVRLKENKELIGYVSLKVDEEEQQTEVDYYFKVGFGQTVLDTVISFIPTEKVDLWIQDTYLTLVDYLYEKGLELKGAEYLMKKKRK